MRRSRVSRADWYSTDSPPVSLPWLIIVGVLVVIIGCTWTSMVGGAS